MSVVSLKEAAKKGDPEAAAELRRFADLVEAGDMTEIIIIGNNVSENVYETFSIWDDRWRVIGAIENAKCRIMGQ